MNSQQRVRLLISYDGTNFHGWAKQPNLITVQGVLEDALNRLFQLPAETITLTVAGRTDVGVHAKAQVAHFDVDSELLSKLVSARKSDSHLDPAALIKKRINRILFREAQLVLQKVELCSSEFDARFSAIWRRYEYRIADLDSYRNPLHSRSTLWLNYRLDLDLINQASELLLGYHDFATFCRPRPGATTIRTLQQFNWSRDKDGVLVAKLQADAFCHSMVRALVGAVAEVAAGRLSLDRLETLFEDQSRTSAFKVLAAQGLTLTEVGYPAEELYFEQSQKSRAKRKELNPNS